MTGGDAHVSLASGRLVFDGALLRSAVPPLWRQVQAAGDVRVLDLAAVSAVDSAGLAFLGALMQRHPQAHIDGRPAGFSDLQAAYRLDERLSFAD